MIGGFVLYPLFKIIYGRVEEVRVDYKLFHVKHFEGAFVLHKKNLCKIEVRFSLGWRRGKRAILHRSVEGSLGGGNIHRLLLAIRPVA